MILWLSSLLDINCVKRYRFPPPTEKEWVGKWEKNLLCRQYPVLGRLPHTCLKYGFRISKRFCLFSYQNSFFISIAVFDAMIRRQANRKKHYSFIINQTTLSFNRAIPYYCLFDNSLNAIKSLINGLGSSVNWELSDFLRALTNTWLQNKL